MNDIVIIIPAYNPNEKIMKEFMEKLIPAFKNILIVNDGSDKKYDKFFEYFEKKGVPVLKHFVNLGKGRAMKTAFNYSLNNYPKLKGVITADCDGQHSIQDIKKCALKLLEDPRKLVLGTRDFNKENVPFKSRYGNKITRFMFSCFVGIKITDTQTGLRAYGVENMKTFMNTHGERYEFETNVLIDCKDKDIKISEVPIETIYINNNATSHFNPVKDSIMIYKLFLKYIFSSISAFLLDIILFTILVKILPPINIGVVTIIVVATILARIVSSIYNFCINSRLVFKNWSKTSIYKYFTLVVIQMFVSAFAVSELFKVLSINSTILKILVDIIIFIVNFIVQREWVFKNKKKDD